MFTGIIEEIGIIKSIKPQGSGKQFRISAKKILDDLEVDQSVSVNGVCLTAVNVEKNCFYADAVGETLARTTLKDIPTNAPVNLERALRLQDRLGGHLVQGHVDGIGRIKNINPESGGIIIKIDIPESLSDYTIQKGSISIDGVSLTIADKSKNIVTVAVIPHTLNHTILQYYKNGDNINIEVDFFAKYIEQFMKKSSETKITTQWLKQEGFK